MTRSRLCTRVIALIAAYAIALHGFLIAFAGLPVAAGAPSEHGSAPFELCTHDLVGGTFFPQMPGAPANGDVHCKFCVGQTHAMGLGPMPWGAPLNFDAPGEPIRFVLNQETAGHQRYLHKQPRGPPAAA
jgi:hypothetical protein